LRSFLFSRGKTVFLSENQRGLTRIAYIQAPLCHNKRNGDLKPYVTENPAWAGNVNGLDGWLRGIIKNKRIKDLP